MKKRNKKVDIFSFPWKTLCVAPDDIIAVRSSKTLKNIKAMTITFCLHIVSRGNSICHYSDLEFISLFLFTRLH